MEQAVIMFILGLVIVIASMFGTGGEVSIRTPINGGRFKGQNEQVCEGKYTLKANDSLEEIALNCYTTTSAIKSANRGITEFTTGVTIHLPGAGKFRGPAAEHCEWDFDCECDHPENRPVQLVIEDDGAIEYTVLEGETLKEIADRFNTSVEEIAGMNPDIRNALKEGQAIWIPHP